MRLRKGGDSSPPGSDMGRIERPAVPRLPLSRSGWLRRQEGFTLLEVLIAIVVASVSLLILTEVFSGGVRTNRLALEVTRSTLLAQGKLVELELLGYQRVKQMPAESSWAPFYASTGEMVFPHMQWKARFTQTEPGLLEVGVIVRWPTREPKHQVQLSTLVAERR